MAAGVAANALENQGEPLGFVALVVLRSTIKADSFFPANLSQAHRMECAAKLQEIAAKLLEGVLTP